MPGNELEQQLQGFLKAEFNRLGVRDGKKPRKLMPYIIANVADVLRGMTLIRQAVLQPTWLDGQGPWPAFEVLPARNGLIHIPSLAEGGDFQLPPTPNFFSSIGLDYNFELAAGAPTEWLRFLSGLWPDDPESMGTLQEFMGYLLTPDTRQQKILMLVGPPRSGKGTIMRVITRLVGEANVANPNLSDFAGTFGLWSLIGKSVAIIADARFGGRRDGSMIVERLLNISGEDSLTIDRKYQFPVTAKLGVRLVLCSNEMPQLTDASGALASRMIVLRLVHSFLGKEDLKLQERLVAEMPGILQWAVEGWARLRERGHFDPPRSSVSMVQELSEIGSPVQAFVKECCTVGDDRSVSRVELYRAFAAWSKARGGECENESVFGRNLRAVCPKIDTVQRTVSGKKVRFYTGIGLLSPDLETGENANGNE